MYNSTIEKRDLYCDDCGIKLVANIGTTAGFDWFCSDCDNTVWEKIVRSNKVKLKEINCPYMKICSVDYRKAIDCCTQRYVNCIEFDVLRIEELNKVVKNYCRKGGSIK